MNAATGFPAPLPVAAPAPGPNRRLATLLVSGLALVLIAGIGLASLLLGETGIRADFAARMRTPDAAHWFGTDFLGRDMLARTVHGLSLSLWVGFLAGSVSALIALGLAVLAATGGRWADAIVSFFTDAAMGLPHMMLLILIAFALGGGTGAVIVAVAVTHWPRLARILRAEILQLRESEYVLVSRRLGKSRWHVARHHMLPHLVPQLLVGLILMVPHAILHEAGLTFLGFGLEPSRPAIGILLSESMRHLTAGHWWLGLFPGLGLLAVVLCLDAVGNGLRMLANPGTRQR